MSQRELGRAYKTNGQFTKAIELLERVVRLERNRSRLFLSQHELAVAYRENGRIKEAIELLEHVVRFQENPSFLLVAQDELFQVIGRTQ